MSFDNQKIEKSTRRIAKFLRKNSRRPSSEAIHDLRTDSRRLETAFVTLKLGAKGKVKRLLRELGEIRKRAGKVRDMDVLTADALTVQHHREQDCIVRLLEHLGAERSKYAKKLRVVINATSPRLRRMLNRTSKRVEKLFTRAEKDPADSNAIPATVAKAIELGAELRSPATLTRANLHAYRLKVKELRNVLQLANESDTQRFVGDLTEVKDAIGEWHDWQELTGIATQVLDHTSCKLMPDLRATSESKYQHALRLTHRLRANYLKPARVKRAKRPARESGLSVAFLDATAAITQN
jgi:CHAD domain-containing protein